MADAEYPPDHEPAMRVPKGGSSCASCKYLGADGDSCKNKYYSCKNKYYIRWHGSGELGAEPDSFCSDWYEPRGNVIKKASQRAS